MAASTMATTTSNNVCHQYSTFGFIPHDVLSGDGDAIMFCRSAKYRLGGCHLTCLARQANSCSILIAA
jgi:hypothetical protein